MNLPVRRTAALTVILAHTWVSAGSAAPDITGKMGVDLDGYTFRKTVISGGRESDVSRTLTYPYVDLQARGPLISENFADYSLNGRLSSTYFRSRNSDEKTTGRADPSLTGYAARLSFFARRAYPLGLHWSRTELPSLRYEVSNRSESELESPALAVVRRYDSILDQRGGTWSVALPREGHFRFEAQRSENNVNRRYDFGEDRDIFVDFVTIRPDTTALVHNVAIHNEIPDEAVVLFIDLALVDTLQAGEDSTFTLDAGTHTVEFVPETLNSFRSIVDVNGDMDWRVVFNPPPGSQDISQTMDSARATFDIGGDAAFQDEASFEYSESSDGIQRTNTRLGVFNNLATYEHSRNTKFDFQTIFTQTDTEVVDVSSQSGDSFLHQSAARWQRRDGPGVRFSHSYNRLSTVTDVSDVVSQTNTILSRASYPTGWRDHEASLRLNATYLQDDGGYRSTQYTTDLENHLATRVRGVIWRPRQLIKYLTSSVKNPDGSTSEWETQNVLEGEIPKLDRIGLLKFKGQFDWRRRSTDAGTNSRRKWIGEVGVQRRLSAFKMGLSTTHELETFGGSVPTPGTDTGSGAGKIEDQVRHSYRVDIQSTSWNRASVGGVAVITTTNDTDIRRITGSATVRIPKLHIPVRTSYLNEERTLRGFPSQTLTQLQTRASLNFRQVSVILNHNFVKDRQISEKFRYQQFVIKIARGFDVL